MQGEFEGFLAIIEDITELASIEETLEEKAKDLFNSNKNVKNLVHILCHDLMNPIGAAASMLEVKGMKGEELTELDKKIEKILDICIGILENVRVLSAVEEGKIKLDLKPVNLYESVKQSLDVVDQKLKNKKIKVNVSIDNSINALADKSTLISTVITNILTNSIKFSKEEAVLDIRAEIEKENVYLILRDYGIGMKKDLLDKIFLHDQETSRLGLNGERGTGFGMPLVKRFVESFEGNLEMESFPVEDFPDDHGTITKIKLWKC